MKTIEVDDELYHYIASKTEKIGESATDILRRLLGFEPQQTEQAVAQQSTQTAASVQAEAVAVETVQSKEQVVEEAAVQAEPVTEQAVKTPAPEAAPAPVKEKKPRKVAPRKLSAKELEEAQEIAKLTASSKLQSLPIADLDMQHGAVGRFLYVLSALESVHGDAFSGVVKIKGRDRLYFADNEAELKESGSSTNPKRIGNTNYWVITNNNTSRKKWMLSEVAKMLGYTESDLRILASKI